MPDTNPTEGIAKGSKHVMTLKGLAYLAKQQTGARLIVTRAEAGAGAVDQELLDQQTAVSNPIAEMEMDVRTVIDRSVVRIPLRLQNTAIGETALIRQVGVYAQDPDEGEILYQIVQYQLPHPLLSLEANNGCVDVFDLDINLFFANAEGAVIRSDPGFMVTRDEFERRLKDLYPDHVLATFRHDLGRYPHCELYRTRCALGVGGLGNGPLGDTLQTIPLSVEQVETHSVVLRVPKPYARGPVEIHEITPGMYSLIYADPGDLESLILLMK